MNFINTSLIFMHDPFVPSLSQREIQKRLEWRDKVVAELIKLACRKNITVHHKKFTVLPGVFPPLWLDSRFLALEVQRVIRPMESVLDLGTGTGIQGIFAALRGAQVLATDVHPKALVCAKLNVRRHQLEKHMRVIESNLFSNVTNTFDVIIFNPTFFWFKPRDEYEISVCDKNYQSLVMFFRQVKAYLKPSGRILIVFSTIGDMQYFRRLIQNNHFSLSILAHDQDDTGWMYSVYQLMKG